MNKNQLNEIAEKDTHRERVTLCSLSVTSDLERLFLQRPAWLQLTESTKCKSFSGSEIIWFHNKLRFIRDPGRYSTSQIF